MPVAVAAAYAQLRAELTVYNVSLIPDQVLGCDSKSCPTNHQPPGWMPWLNSTPPLPPPAPPLPPAEKDIHSSINAGDWGASDKEAPDLTPSGWVCDLTVPAKASQPCVVTLVLDGRPFGQPAIANITRPGVVPSHCPTVHAGFVFSLPKAAIAEGSHEIRMTIADHLDGTVVTLGNKVATRHCFVDGAPHACSPDM